MPRLRLEISMLVMSACFAWTQTDDEDVARKKYEAYMSQVMAGDLNIDWRDFRLSAALGHVDQGYYWVPVHDQVVDDLAAGAYEKALAEAQTVIDHNMANGEGNRLATQVLRRMGRNDEAQKEAAILNAIGQSIWRSGDGKSSSTAWFTVAPSETVFFMWTQGAVIEKQQLVYTNGHAYDKLTVRDRKGKTRVVWFNTDTNELLKRRSLNPKVVTQ